jgi:hypothetical protein
MDGANEAIQLLLDGCLEDFADLGGGGKDCGVEA